MCRNEIHPITLFGTAMGFFALLAISICVQIYLAKGRYGYALEGAHGWSFEELGVVVSFFAGGCFLLVGGLGLVLRKNWARHLLQIGLLIGGLAWLTFMDTMFHTSGTLLSWAVLIGVTACILGLVSGSILFLNNRQWILPCFVGSLKPDQASEVLDQEW
jgi:hypothetical protein